MRPSFGIPQIIRQQVSENKSHDWLVSLSVVVDMRDEKGTLPDFLSLIKLGYSVRIEECFKNTAPYLQTNPAEQRANYIHSHTNITLLKEFVLLENYVSSDLDTDAILMICSKWIPKYCKIENLEN